MVNKVINFMDIAKAFDTVPHKRLKLKLQCYGIFGNTYLWISSFLSDHHQKVVIGNISSDSVSVVSSVPQGIVLGPKLFLVYINDVYLRTLSTVRTGKVYGYLNLAYQSVMS